MPTALITGSNRGIGLEFVRSFAEDGWRVHACCRHPEKADELRRLSDKAGDRMQVHRLDVTDGLKVASLARALADEPIDLLLNNAGLYGPRAGFGETDFDAWQSVLAVNAFAPLRMAERFHKHVTRSRRKLIVNVSSRMGSIGDNRGGGAYIYRASKAALNAIAKSLSVDLAARDVTVVVLHPGWVRTEMGGPSAALTPAESVEGMRRVIDRLTPADNGRFFNHDGSEIPW